MKFKIKPAKTATQNSILCFLKENQGKKYTTKRISKILNYSQNKISIKINKLVKFHFVKVEEVKLNQKRTYFYWVKK